MPPPFQISPYEFGELDLLSVTQMRCHIMLQFAKHANQTYLFETAGVLLTRLPQWCKLKAWDHRLRKRIGFKKAMVAWQSSSTSKRAVTTILRPSSEVVPI